MSDLNFSVEMPKNWDDAVSASGRILNGCESPDDSQLIAQLIHDIEWNDAMKIIVSPSISES